MTGCILSIIAAALVGIINLLLILYFLRRSLDNVARRLDHMVKQYGEARHD